MMQYIQTKNNGAQVPLQFIVTAEVVGDRRPPATRNSVVETQGSPSHPDAKSQAAWPKLGSLPIPTLDTLTATKVSAAEWPQASSYCPCSRPLTTHSLPTSSPSNFLFYKLDVSIIS